MAFLTSIPSFLFLRPKLPALASCGTVPHCSFHNVHLVSPHISKMPMLKVILPTSPSPGPKSHQVGTPSSNVCIENPLSHVKDSAMLFSDLSALSIPLCINLWCCITEESPCPKPLTIEASPWYTTQATLRQLINIRFSFHLPILLVVLSSGVFSCDLLRLRDRHYALVFYVKYHIHPYAPADVK